MANIDHLPDEFEAIPLHHELIVAVLTRERIRIINHLRQNGPVTSLNELANALGRDRSAVSRDLKYLEGSLVRIEQKGRRKEISATDRPIIIY